MKPLNSIAIIILSVLIINCGEITEQENYDRPEKVAVKLDNRKLHTNIQDKDITNVYVKDHNTIMFDCEDEKGNVLHHDEDWVFSILMITSDNHWLIIERTPAIVGEGRVATEKFLFYLPEERIIDIEAIDQQLSTSFMSFCNFDNDKYLITSIIGSNKNIPVLLERLKKGTDIEILLSDDKKNLKTSLENDAIVLELQLGEDDGQFGQGMESKQLDDLRFVDAIPAFSAHKGMLYVIDAINFRIMVYDFLGEFQREVKYPKIKNGNTVVAKNISLDDEYIYLSASWKSSEKVIYAIDKEIGNIEQAGHLPEPPEAAYYTLPYSNNCSRESDNFIIYRGNDSIFGVYNLDEEKSYLLTDFEKNDESATMIEPFNNANHDSSLGEEKYYRSVSLYPSIVGLDHKGNIYVYVDEYTDGALESQYRFLKVISPEGNELYSIYLGDWWGGPNFERIAITKDGKVFIGYYDGDKVTTSTKYTIKRIK